MSGDVRERDRAHSLKGARTNFLTLVGQTTFFLFSAAAARLFGQALWGAYTTAYAWIDVLVRTAVMAGDKGVLIFVPARRAQGDEAGAVRAVASTLRLAIVASIVLALGMVGASFIVERVSGEPLDGQAMRLLSPVVVMSAIAMLLLASTMAAKVLHYNFLAKGVTEPVVMFVAAVILGTTLPSMGGLALAPLLTGAVVLAVAVWAVGQVFVRRDILASLRRDPIDREMVRFVLPLAASELINILAVRLGSFILIAYVVVEDRAVFNTCLLLAGTVSYVRGTFDTVLAPIAAEAWAQQDHERLAVNLQHQTRIVLLVAIPFASLFIVGGPAILALYGEGFASGHRTLMWIAIAHLVNATLGLASWVLMAARMSRSMLINNIIKLALNVGLSVLLIPYLGIEGAALATMVAITTQLSIQVWEVWKLCGVHPFSPRLAQIAILGVVTLGAELLAYGLAPGTPVVRALGVLAVGTPLYALVARRWREKPLPPRAGGAAGAGGAGAGRADPPATE